MRIRQNRCCLTINGHHGSFHGTGRCGSGGLRCNGGDLWCYRRGCSPPPQALIIISMTRRPAERNNERFRNTILSISPLNFVIYYSSGYQVRGVVGVEEDLSHLMLSVEDTQVSYSFSRYDIHKKTDIIKRAPTFCEWDAIMMSFSEDSRD